MPNFTFYGECKQATKKFFLFLTLSAVPKKSTPAKFAYIRHFQRIGISVTKFEKKTHSFLKMTLSLPSPLSMLKLANVYIDMVSLMSVLVDSSSEPVVFLD